MGLSYLTGGSSDNLPVGKWISNGVQSQPILLQLANKNITLLNQNPDAVYPKPAPRVDIPATTAVTGSNTHATPTATQQGLPTTPAGTPYAVSLPTASGAVKSGGEESSARVRTARVSWRELLRTD